jgi:hypothetical protein
MKEMKTANVMTNIGFPKMDMSEMMVFLTVTTASQKKNLFLKRESMNLKKMKRRFKNAPVV